MISKAQTGEALYSLYKPGGDENAELDRHTSEWRNQQDTDSHLHIRSQTTGCTAWRLKAQAGTTPRTLFGQFEKTNMKENKIYVHLDRGQKRDKK